jgi:hypothetical protein
MGSKSCNSVAQVLTALSKQREQMIEFVELCMVHLNAGFTGGWGSIDSASYAEWDFLDLPCAETTLQKHSNHSHYFNRFFVVFAVAVCSSLRSNQVLLFVMAQDSYAHSCSLCEFTNLHTVSIHTKTLSLMSMSRCLFVSMLYTTALTVGHRGEICNFPIAIAAKDGVVSQWGLDVLISRN